MGSRRAHSEHLISAFHRKEASYLKESLQVKESTSRLVSSSFISLSALVLIAGLISAPQNANAQAQEVDPFAGVEELVVTGGNAAGLIEVQDTSSIVFDASELDSKGIQDVSDIAAYVPNLEISSANATNASFFVRGVGLQDFSPNASSSVPIFQDGIPRNPSATQLTGLYDVGGLNVLRGPQGSGNYRNASGGAIVISSAKPQPEFSGFAQVSLGQLVTDDARDAPRYKFEGAINAPIFEDWVSARISARYDHEVAFFENGCANRIAIADRTVAAITNDLDAQLCASGLQGNTTRGDGEGINIGDVSGVRPFLRRRIGEVDDWSFRGQIRIQPPDTNMDWTLRVEVSNLNRDANVGQSIGTGGNDGSDLGTLDSNSYRDRDVTRQLENLVAPLAEGGLGLTFSDAFDRLERDFRRRAFDTGPFRGDFDSPGRILLETHSASLTGALEYDEFTVDINLGFLDYRKSSDTDTDLSPNARFPAVADDQAWEVAGSIDFSGDTIADIPVDWKAGGYSLIEQVESNQIQFLNINGSAATVDRDFTQEIYSFGLYAEASYEFLESFEIAGGIRYNWESKDIDIQDVDTLLGLPNPRPRLTGSSNQRTWDTLTGFGKIAYRFTEDISTYIKYVRGFKAGHFNTSIADAAKIPGVGFADPEQIDEFEWGLDISAWEGRAQISTALFYYNYRDYQVFRLSAQSSGVFNIVQNADKARVYGAESTIVLNPLEGYAPEAIENLSIKIEFGWLDTEFLDYTEIDERVFGGANTSTLIDYSGQPLINAPELQVTGTFTWPIVLSRIGTITPQYDFTWTDDTPFDTNRGRGQIDGLGESKFSPFLIGNLAYILHNVRLTYEPPGDSGLRISGWCRNLADERYSEFAVDISNFAQQQLHFIAAPRSCGADMRFSW